MYSQKGTNSFGEKERESLTNQIIDVWKGLRRSECEESSCQVNYYDMNVISLLPGRRVGEQWVADGNELLYDLNSSVSEQSDRKKKKRRRGEEEKQESGAREEREHLISCNLNSYSFFSFLLLQAPTLSLSSCKHDIQFPLFIHCYLSIPSISLFTLPFHSVWQTFYQNPLFFSLQTHSEFLLLISS